MHTELLLQPHRKHTGSYYRKGAVILMANKRIPQATHTGRRKAPSACMLVTLQPANTVLRCIGPLTELCVHPSTTTVCTCTLYLEWGATASRYLVPTHHSGRGRGLAPLGEPADSKHVRHITTLSGTQPAIWTTTFEQTDLPPSSVSLHVSPPWPVFLTFLRHCRGRFALFLLRSRSLLPRE